MPERLWEGWYRRYYDEPPFRSVSFLITTVFFVLAMAFGVLMLVQQWHFARAQQLPTMVILVFMASIPWFLELGVRGRIRKLLQGYQGADREELAKDAARLSLTGLMTAYFVIATAFMLLAYAWIR